MTRFDRAAAFTLALALFANLLSGCNAAVATLPAADVAEFPLAAGGGRAGAQEPPAVRAAYIEGAKGFFQPEKTLTRAEAAQLFQNLGLESPGTRAFTDVPSTAWYAPAVARLSGALRGYGDGTFRPAASITLAEFLTVLCRLEGMKPSRAKPGEPWYAPAVEAAREAGWFEGIDEVLPQAPATRRTAVMVCNRATGRTPDRASIDRLARPVFLDVRDKSAPGYYDILEAAVDHSADWSQSEVPSLKPGIHVLNGAAYYVNDNGTVYETAGVLSLGADRYLVSDDYGKIYADGAIHLVDGAPVYCTEDGTLLKNQMWHEFRFDADGRYTSGDAELDQYLEDAVGTGGSKSQLEKLYAANCLVRKFQYLGRNQAYGDSVKTMPYADAVKFAKKIFETGKGDCYNFAAAYFFLAKRLGYDATAVIGKCRYSRWGPDAYPHAWLEIPIDGKIWLFDAQIENNNIRNGVSNEQFGAFKVTYETAPAVYMKN